MLDERLVTALHVETLRQDQVHAEHEPHVLFQASTIGALLDGPTKATSASPSSPGTAISASAP